MRINCWEITTLKGKEGSGHEGQEKYKVVYAMISGALMGYHNQLRENLLVYGIDVGDLK